MWDQYSEDDEPILFFAGVLLAYFGLLIGFIFAPAPTYPTTVAVPQIIIVDQPDSRIVLDMPFYPNDISTPGAPGYGTDDDGYGVQQYGYQAPLERYTVAYPATLGHQHGVTQMGTVSRNEHPETASWNNGITYKCTDNTTPFTIPAFDAQARYNGEVVRATVENDYYNAGMPTQDSVTLDLTGAPTLTSQIVAIIVRVDNDDPSAHADDKVVQITAMTFDSGTVLLPTTSFVPDYDFYVADLTLCVTKAPKHGRTS
jgi:hypothetical protein